MFSYYKTLKQKSNKKISYIFIVFSISLFLISSLIQFLTLCSHTSENYNKLLCKKILFYEGMNIPVSTQFLSLMSLRYLQTVNVDIKIRNITTTQLSFVFDENLIIKQFGFQAIANDENNLLTYKLTAFPDLYTFGFIANTSFITNTVNQISDLISNQSIIILEATI